MKEHKDIDQIIAAYLSGTHTEQEKKDVEDWIAESKENALEPATNSAESEKKADEITTESKKASLNFSSAVTPEPHSPQMINFVNAKSFGFDLLTNDCLFICSWTASNSSFVTIGL